jgi:hypothetical protein
MNEKRARCDKKGPPEEPKASRLGSPLPTSNGGAVQAEGTRPEKIQDSHQGGTQNSGKAGSRVLEFLVVERESSPLAWKVSEAKCPTSAIHPAMTFSTARARTLTQSTRGMDQRDTF